MPKIKTTQKAIKQAYPRIISIPYCRAQYLLQYVAPFYYTCSNLYGWRSDVYIVDGVAISTGYAPFGNICPAYEIVRKWEEKARAVSETIDHWRDRYEIVNGYLKEFIKEATQ